MCADLRVRRAALVSVLVVAGCATHTAPRGFLPSVRSAETDTYGGWIDVTFRSTGDTRHVAGELIAASPDTLWVLTDMGDGTAIPASEVMSGQLVGYDSQPDHVSVATFLGVLSTLSNGVLLAFTAPTWVIVGTFATASQSKVAIEKLPTRSVDLAPYARFPQGMPPGVALTDLRPKK